jgi:inosose dehydratase
MHFKDINQKILNTVYEEKIDFDTAVKMGVFCPLGSGIIDFKKVYKNLDEISYSGYATIEQDIDPNEGLDPLQYAKKSLVYLNNLKN